MKVLLLLALASVAGTVEPVPSAWRLSMLIVASSVPTMSVVAMMDDPTDAMSREIAVGISVVDLPADDAMSREIAVAPSGANVSIESAASREIAVAPAEAPVNLENAASREIAVEWNPDKPFFAESREISVGGNRPLTVQVEFQDIELSLAPVETSIVVTNPNGVVLFSETVTLTDGAFTIPNMPRMYLHVSAKTTHWLRKRLSINHGALDTVNLSLINGDVDEDNEITLVDFGQFASAFGSVDGDPNWIANADLDGDGEVNLVDYGTLAANFGLAGDDE